MKLASLRHGRDGRLLVVSRDLARAVAAGAIAPTLQAALDDWDTLAPALQALAAVLEAGRCAQAFPLVVQDLAAPLPRAYEFLDGSAYLPHVERVRRARGAAMPPALYEDPLMYQGGSGAFLGPREAIVLPDPGHGIDLEAEVAVVTGDVAMGVSPARALDQVRLVGLLNDVSLRALIPAELAKGFGFVQSKPRSALSPVLATPDELGPAWRDGRLHGAMRVRVNGALLGMPEAGQDMQFGFDRLIAHAARTRGLVAGTVVGAGTVANHDISRGASCLAERRTIETLRDGHPSTPWLRPGDTIAIELVLDDGTSPFGAIEQRVVVPG